MRAYTQTELKALELKPGNLIVAKETTTNQMWYLIYCNETNLDWHIAHPGRSRVTDSRRVDVYSPGLTPSGRRGGVYKGFILFSSNYMYEFVQ